MDLGFVAHYSPSILEFAKKAGFDSLELYVNKGTALNLDLLKPEDIQRIVGDIESRGLRACSLTCSTNHLAGDGNVRAENNAYFRKALKLCRSFGTAIMTTNSWGDPWVSPAENLKTYKVVFSEFARIAEGEGIRIALENCPHIQGYPQRVGSIGYSPEIWKAMFELVPSISIGLEMDPSHLFWLGIDIPRAIREFGDRVFAFHAKDCEILEEGRYRYGILGRQLWADSASKTDWYRYRLPGLGQIDWKELFRALFDIGYQGPCIIEHEDPVFGGDRSELGLELGPKTETGLRMGIDFLRSLMPV
jgi:sugar phosphate isomerase/epimerase